LAITGEHRCVVHGDHASQRLAILNAWRLAAPLPPSVLDNAAPFGVRIVVHATSNGRPRRRPRSRPMARRRRPVTTRTRLEELDAIYPHRWSVPSEVWTRFFASAEHEISILAHSSLFLAENAGILRILADKGRLGGRQQHGCCAWDGLGHAAPRRLRSRRLSRQYR
jgi:hypothetical protein